MHLQARVLSLWPVALHGSLLATLWLVVLPIITSAVFQVGRKTRGGADATALYDTGFIIRVGILA